MVRSRCSKALKLLTICLTLLTSCITYRDVNYHPTQGLGSEGVTSIIKKKPQFVFRPGDRVVVDIRSVEPSFVKILIEPKSSYDIETDGYVTFPLIGRTKVAELTIDQLKETLQEKLKEYYNDIYVEVSRGRINFTIDGEVRNTGRYTVNEPDFDLFQAIAMVEGLTIHADLSRVLLIRQADSGRELHLIDLKDPNLMESELFYLRSEDHLFFNQRKSAFLRNNSNLTKNILNFSGLALLAILVISQF